MLSGASIGNLFLGGMAPGILIGLALMAYIAYIARKRNYPKGKRYPLRQFIKITIKAFPALLTPVILLGGIYSGIVTPTEAGALAGFYAVIIYCFYGPSILPLFFSSSYLAIYPFHILSEIHTPWV
ncbi:unnamed protein product [marine sediment metagenome]|uniref:TRAP C4-dicarboxylate transport system permease DctM subunit domain-containing protein n=1 Tax=marine sediment metagenome TaxID=412755 RepID=X1AVI4_9ZZZZ